MKQELDDSGKELFLKLEPVPTLIGIKAAG
jgi:hypothetical protein